MLHRLTNLLKLNKLGEILHKIKDYNRVCEEILQYKQNNDELYINNQSLILTIGEKNKEIIELDKSNSILREKLLTSRETKYDEIGLPKLDIKKLKSSLKLADNFTLNQVVELLKIDYIDMVSILWNSLEDANKYEISIASNAIRKRIGAWIEVLQRNWGKETFIDRAKGTMETIEKKK